MNVLKTILSGLAVIGGLAMATLAGFAAWGAATVSAASVGPESLLSVGAVQGIDAAIALVSATLAVPALVLGSQRLIGGIRGLTRHRTGTRAATGHPEPRTRPSAHRDGVAAGMAAIQTGRHHSLTARRAPDHAAAMRRRPVERSVDGL